VLAGWRSLLNTRGCYAQSFPQFSGVAYVGVTVPLHRRSTRSSSVSPSHAAGADSLGEAVPA